ncbi:MAG TPA: MBL fold metallo-hydrolase [Vicinamibacterales bacterium]|nr:MBL fold metallo-hydrolase [Vicinamibacterales bacterium]
MRLGGAALVLGLVVATGGVAPTATQPAAPARIGEVLPAWTPGTLDIHQIATGRGNSALLIYPDGTTLLIDAGDAGPTAYADPRPDGSRPPAEWIARYVTHMTAGRDARLDYALVTHFHPDHIGVITGKEPMSKTGDYRLSGITDVGDRLPIGTLIDRGYDYQPPPASDQMFANYRRFLDAQVSTRHLQVVHASPGRTDQLAPQHGGATSAPFAVRIIAANNLIWTGQGDAARVRFPPLDQIPMADDRPNENMCSIALRVSYGKFDFFTGGDMPGYPVPGAPAWHDLETDVAKVIGPTDVHIVNHHGSIEEENPFFLATLKSRVMIVPAWAATHPSPDVLKRMLATRVYPDPRDIFILEFREATKATIGARANQVASDHGHVVVRVEPGGDRYWVLVLDDLSESYRVTSVHGPYSSQ